MFGSEVSFVLMAVALVVTTLVYPHVLNFAKRHNIVDNPNARKLQRVPVPVMGGTTVFIGILVPLLACCFIAPDARIVPIMMLLSVMFLIGVWDDIRDVSPAFRFLIELLVVWSMILTLGVEIDDLHGIWGIHRIPATVSIPLSLVAGVGVINAVNLIDGVDGYCSSYGIMACAVFSVIFFRTGDMVMFSIALIGIGALIPFFFHNVFGKTSKMFLGDSGSLMLGTLLTLFMFRMLSSSSPCAVYGDLGLSLPALTLAILAVPVFDTLKVMIYRVVKGRSPFHPDKTHLHHLFIDMEYSHLATSGIIVFSNVLIVILLLLVWWVGGGADLQIYSVILVSMLYIWGFYFFMERERRKNNFSGSPLFQRLSRHGRGTNISATPAWQFIRRYVDGRFLGGTGANDEASTEGMEMEPSRLDPRIR